MSMGNLEEIIDEKSVTPHYGLSLAMFSIHLDTESLVLAVMPSCHPRWDLSTMSACCPS